MTSGEGGPVMLAFYNAIFQHSRHATFPSIDRQ